MKKFIDTLFAIVVVFTVVVWAALVPIPGDKLAWTMFVLARLIMVGWLSYVVFRHEAQKDHWQ